MTDDRKRQEAADILQGAGLDTLAVRAGQVRTHEGEHGEAIFTTSSFVFPDAATAAARFGGESEGNVYSRYTNPTVRNFEDRIAAMEGGEAAVATSSGMAAILSTFMALLSAGDHVVCSRSVFGTTTVLLNKYMSKFGISVTYVNPVDYTEWQQAIQDNTRILFLETPSNPLSEIVDIERMAEMAKANSCLLVVDNCFCTPVLQKPFDYGADIVVHSATKYLDGQGRCVGGAVIGKAEHMDEVTGFLRSCGPTMSAFNAWVFLKGLETLRIRMEAHCASAQELAGWLESQSGIEKVHYAGLKSHPGHALASRQQRGFGGVLAFEVAGGQPAAWKLIDNTRILSITANLGDAKSTIVHPATTTHGRLSDADKAQSGIKPNLIRVSVGLEDIHDIKADIARGLAAL